MQPLSSAELGVVAGELGAIVSSYFKNFYELGKGSFLITFSKERKETAVYVNLANTINITQFRERASQPTEFALALRKGLEGSRVAGVEQHGTDRILVIELSGKEEKRLIVEMFGKGNLILINNRGIIENVYSSVSFSDRSLRKGVQYAFPQQRGKPKADAESERLEEVGKRFATLSELLDSLYAEERSTQINPEKSRESEELRKSIEKLHKQIEEMGIRSEECKKVANGIFARMHEINELLERVRKSRARSAAELGDTGRIMVKRLDAKRKTIAVELE